MKIIKDTEFGGERPLSAQHDLTIENVMVHTGEPLAPADCNIIIKMVK